MSAPSAAHASHSRHELELRARRRVIVLGVVLPVVLALVSLSLQLLWLPTLPSPAATHWSAAGEANGTGPAWTFPVLTLVLGLALPVLLGVLALATIDSGRRAAGVLVAVAAGPIGFLPVVFAISIAVQRGVATAQDSRLPPWLPLIALLVELAIGVVVFLTFPELPAPVRVLPAAPAPLAIPEGATLAWSRAARAPWPLTAVVLLAIAVTGVLGVTALLSGSLVGLVPLSATVLLSVSALLLLQVRVTVGAAGVTMAGEFGLPRIRIPYSDITGVSVVEVEALADFGGYGIRYGRGGVTGVVLRSGEALRIERRGRRTLVITVPDAATAAAAIETMRARDGVR